MNFGTASLLKNDRNWLLAVFYDDVYAPPLAAWEPVIGESRGFPLAKGG